MLPEDLAAVSPLGSDLESQVHAVIDGKAKPKGSLGRVEDLARQIALIQQSTSPRISKPALVVFAADHGMTRSGVAAFPSGVTVSMVDTLLSGKATANAFARAVGADVHVVDAGVKAKLDDRQGLIHRKIGHGTRDASVEPAMTVEEARRALAEGVDVISGIITNGADLIALGEMGIGNSSSASLIIHRLTNAPLHLCVGPGAGHSESSMRTKRETLARAAERSDVKDPLQVLAEFGGYEIAMMAGAFIGCAQHRVPVLVDGFICSAAALMAIRLSPNVRDYCIFTHASAEPGHAITMTALDARPLLDLDMRLGEGTGALLAIPIAKAACAMMTEVASLADVMAASR